MMLYLVRDNRQNSDRSGEIRAILRPVIVQDQCFASRPLMRHEGELLIEILKQLSFDRVRLLETVAFLLEVDPLRSGLTLEQLGQYVQAAIRVVDRPQWLTNALNMIADMQPEVMRRTGYRLFRLVIVEAAIAFYLTGLNPEFKRSTG